MTTLNTPKARVLRKRPGSWWCGCGCRSIFNQRGYAIGHGESPWAAWKDAAKRVKA